MAKIHPVRKALIMNELSRNFTFFVKAIFVSRGQFSNGVYKIALIFLFFGLLPVSTEAATLYFSPSSGEYVVSRTLSVSVYVSSAGQAINSASGIISFPQDKLEVTSLSRTGSIFTLWVQEPSFSNSAGTVNFEGVVLNPGFTGATG